MEFTKTPIDWQNKGTEPSSDIKTSGFTAGYKPPAEYHNYLFANAADCIKEVQEKLSAVGDKQDTMPIKSVGGTSIDGGIAKEGATIIADLRTPSSTSYDSLSYPIKGAVAKGTYAVAIAIAKAIGDYSIAGGYGCVTNGRAGISLGNVNISNDNSTVFGNHNVGNKEQFVIGKYAKKSTSLADAFVVGNGTLDATTINRGNAFRVTYEGKAYGLSAYGSSGADYAEYFEWTDGNPNNEDRRGKFVTLDGEKIRFATSDDNYILGVISATPCVEGDNFSEDWQGKYLTDVFGQKLTQTVHVPTKYETVETIDPETGETTTEQVLIEEEHDEIQWVLNPDFDDTKEYVSREFRKEWSPVGMIGKLVVVDNGTCEVNGYCKAGENGIATKADSGYRVLSRIDDTHIRVLIK